VFLKNKLHAAVVLEDRDPEDLNKNLTTQEVEEEVGQSQHMCTIRRNPQLLYEMSPTLKFRRSYSRTVRKGYCKLG